MNIAQAVIQESQRARGAAPQADAGDLLQNVLAETAALEVPSRKQYGAAVRKGDAQAIAVAAKEAGISRGQLELDLRDVAKMRELVEDVSGRPAKQNQLANLDAEIETWRAEWRQHEARITAELTPRVKAAEGIRANLEATRGQPDRLNGLFADLAKRDLATHEDLPAHLRGQLATSSPDEKESAVDDEENPVSN